VVVEDAYHPAKETIGGNGADKDDKTDDELRYDAVLEFKEKEPSEALQPSDKLEEVYQKAKEAKPEFDKEVKKIADGAGCEAIPAPLKGEPRAKTKIASDYGGHANKLLDVLRASVVCKNFKSVEHAKELVATQFGKDNVVRIKDRFKEKLPSGYRDILMNVKTANHHVAELQVHLAAIQAVKKDKAHKLYEAHRQKIVLIGKSYKSLQENEWLDSLERQMKELFDEAFVKAGGAL
jgi:hypothetical protein